MPAENDARVMIRWSSMVAHQAVVSAWEATIASGVDNAASPRLADTAERDYFTLRERLITMQKQLEGTRSILMSSRGVAHISMGNSCNYCEQYTRASSGV